MKIIQRAIMNTRNKQKISLSKETEDMRRIQNEILPLIYTLTKMGDLDSMMEKTEERVSELEDRTAEITQSVQRK